MDANAQKRSVRYEVRSDGGVLTYDTLLHVEQAFIAGFIGPDDELRQEGDRDWRKVSALPQLASVRRAQSSLRGDYAWHLIGSVILAVGAFIGFATGRHWIGLALALVLSSVLFSLTMKVSKLKR